MKKKGDAEPIWVIIGAILAIIVLILVVYILYSTSNPVREFFNNILSGLKEVDIKKMFEK